MKALHKLTERIGRLIINRRSPRKRERRGYDLSSAHHVLILFSDTDESRYRAVRSFCKELKDEYGLKRVKGLAFIDGSEKEVPVYHAHKLEMDYFTRDELTWKLRSSQNLRNILNEPCDILIDASEGSNLYLEYVLKYTTASMVVGRSGTVREQMYDVSINISPKIKTEVYLNEVKQVLSKFKIK